MNSGFLWITLCATGSQHGCALWADFFCGEEKIAGGELIFTEAPQAHPVAGLLEKQRSIQQQPDFQRATKQARQQFQVAHLGQALPTALFQLLPVGGFRQLQPVVSGQVAAEAGDATL